MLANRLFSQIVLGFLSGCAALPHSTQPLTPLKTADLEAAQALAPQSLPFADADLNQLSFGDPQLMQLYTIGLAGAPDYAQALSRVRKADAAITVQRAVDVPQVSADGSVMETIQSKNLYPPNFSQFIPKGFHSNSRLTAQAMWDVDLFGRNRAALAAATSEAEATRFDAAQARLVLIANIALAYADYARAVAYAAVTSQVAQAQTQAVKLYNDRFRAGLDPRSMMLTADAQRLAAVKADVLAQGAVKADRYRLAALVGKGPDFGLSLGLPQLGIPAQPIAPLGIDVVAARPDVAAARTRIEAAASRVKAARRDFYPNLSLSALAGFQSLDFAQLLQGGSAIPSFGPAIHLPIFEGGRLRGALRGQQADYDTAVATYNLTLGNAVQEASTNLVNMRDAEQAYSVALDNVLDASRNLRLAQERFNAKLDSELSVLTAQTTLLNAQTELAEAKSDIMSRTVEFIRSLGGHVATPMTVKENSHG